MNIMNWETTRIKPSRGQKVIVLLGDNVAAGEYINEFRPMFVEDGTDGKKEYFFEYFTLWTPYPIDFSGFLIDQSPAPTPETNITTAYALS